MKKVKWRLLIVDDDELVLNALVRSFKAAKSFEYEIIAVLNLQEVVRRQLEDQEFDICIFDLGFGPTDREPGYLGFMALVDRSELNRAELRVVYSGHPEIRNVVRAMQLGASDFVSKAECPPHELVERVEAMLIQRRQTDERNRRVYEYLDAQHNEHCRQYPGRFLAIALSETGPIVVADGRSRLDVLLKYDDCRRNQPNDQWPVVPHLHFVPSASTQ